MDFTWRVEKKQSVMAHCFVFCFGFVETTPATPGGREEKNSVKSNDNRWVVGWWGWEW